jgi:hypothetical protein
VRVSQETIEYLTCGFAGELKFSGDATSRKFEGLGAVFKNVDAYGDVIEPGAFAAWLSDVKSGKQDWPAMLSQHGAWGMTSEDLTPVGAWLASPRTATASRSRASSPRPSAASTSTSSCA